MKDTQELKELNDVESQEENEFIRRAQQGDRDAFTKLVNLYQRQVFKLAFGFFQDKDDAMEIVQETFLRVYEKIPSFENDGNRGTNAFRNWIYRIAYRLCVDFYRKFKKKKVDDKELYEFHESRECETTNLENPMDRLHFKYTLKKCVLGLSKRQQMVFMLKQYSELKHEEISHVLNISVGTVKTLYHRAVKSLEKRLLSGNVPG
ncbi:MAG: RNA polymerase sigma factor [Acidobacteria bacterium]|jgi:RNA polymerase sigma-70 factor (ECF subfamily)|nr:RNA polymerase sigma factor [Acidobacteriota bacterium]